MTTRMTIVAALAATAALAVPAAGAGGVAGATACVPGVKKIDGVTARTFCGGARATVKLNRKTISYRGGECARSIGLFSVNIGTVVLGDLKNRPDYFGLTATAKAGNQSRQAISLVHAGKREAIIGSVTLKPGLRAGSFSGKAFGSSNIVSGSFAC
jgi:hypothetical protein